MKIEEIKLYKIPNAIPDKPREWCCYAVFTIFTTAQFTAETRTAIATSRWLIFAFVLGLLEARKIAKENEATLKERQSQGWDL